jgi:hypothetical protein
MKIRPADADDLGPKDDILRSGRPRFRHIIDDHHAGGLGYRRQHLRTHISLHTASVPPMSLREMYDDFYVSLREIHLLNQVPDAGQKGFYVRGDRVR